MKRFFALLLLSVITREVYPSPTKRASSDYVDPEEDNLNLNNVIFKLYTRENPEEPDILFINDVRSVDASHFDPKRPTKLMTHGFQSSTESVTIVAPKDAYMVTEDCNFFGIDWSKCASNIYYPEAAQCAKDLGQYIGQFLTFLHKHYNLDPKDVHLLGHSLGAHAVAIAGTYFPEKKIGRITALDPASPLFENVDLSERIDPSDALFVDVIHSSVKSLGIKEPVGTVDFYPNGGSDQPGCFGLMTCSHSRSHEYFVDSVYKENQEKYVGFSCNSLEEALDMKCNGETGLMGYAATSSKPGIYYVEVKKKP